MVDQPFSLATNPFSHLQTYTQNCNISFFIIYSVRVGLAIVASVASTANFTGSRSTLIKYRLTRSRRWWRP
jgi:hypothetical protein